jgi:hypothetical protein
MGYTVWYYQVSRFLRTVSDIVLPEVARSASRTACHCWKYLVRKRRAQFRQYFQCKLIFPFSSALVILFFFVIFVIFSSCASFFVTLSHFVYVFSSL